MLRRFPSTRTHPSTTSSKERSYPTISNPEDHLSLENGSSVPRTMWEPLLGGDLEQIWESALKNPEDFIEFSGTTAHHIWMGVLYLNRNHRLPIIQRTDIDGYTSSKQVFDRIADAVSVGDNGNIPRIGIGSIEKYSGEYAKATGSAPEEYNASNFFSKIGLFAHESVTFRMQKNKESGQLELILNDPKNITLNEQSRNRLCALLQFGRRTGAVLELNESSQKYSILKRFLQGQEIESKAILWSIKSMSMAVTQSALFDMMIDRRDPLWKLFEQLSNKLFVKKEYPSVPKEALAGDSSSEQWIKRRFAADLVTAISVNPSLGFRYFLDILPYGAIFSDKVGEIFNPLAAMKDRTADLINADPKLRYADKALRRLYRLLIAEYKPETIPANIRTQRYDFYPRIHEFTSSPRGISEILALLVVALDWDDGEHEREIDELVEQWQSYNLTDRASGWRYRNPTYSQISRRKLDYDVYKLRNKNKDLFLPKLQFIPKEI